MNDPVIDELHAIKDQLSKEAGYSVDELFRQMRKEIDRSEWNYVSFDKKDGAGKVLKPVSR